MIRPPSFPNFFLNLAISWLAKISIYFHATLFYKMVVISKYVRKSKCTKRTVYAARNQEGKQAADQEGSHGSSDVEDVAIKQDCTTLSMHKNDIKDDVNKTKGSFIVEFASKPYVGKELLVKIDLTKKLEGVGHLIKKTTESHGRKDVLSLLQPHLVPKLVLKLILKDKSDMAITIRHNRKPEDKVGPKTAVKSKDMGQITGIEDSGPTLRVSSANLFLLFTKPAITSNKRS